MRGYPPGSPGICIEKLGGAMTEQVRGLELPVLTSSGLASTVAEPHNYFSNGEDSFRSE